MASLFRDPCSSASGVGRIWYALAYQQDPAKRGPGFGISFLAIAGMWAGGLWAAIKLLIAQ